MTSRNLRVTKRPRDSPVPDVPINFKPFENLHLELLEVKEKLKPGLPLIPLSRPKLKQNDETKIMENGDRSLQNSPLNSPRKEHAKDKSIVTPREKTDHDSSKKERKRKRREEKRARLEAKRQLREKKNKNKNITAEDEELILDLGEDEPKKSSKKNKKERSESEEEPSEKEESGQESGEQEESSKEEKEESEEDEYAGLTPEEKEAKQKEEYIWKFRILKKQYGKNASIPIPDYNEHSDLGEMKTSYERTIRELYLDDAIESYETYLIGGWIIMEYVCVKIIGIDLRGFTARQVRLMHKYRRMLIELGEKSYTRWGMSIPVEIRLMGMILFQAGIFYLQKVLQDKFGNEAADLFGGVTGQPAEEKNGDDFNEEEIKDVPKKKMNGPRMKAEDIKNRYKQQQ